MDMTVPAGAAPADRGYPRCRCGSRAVIRMADFAENVQEFSAKPASGLVFANGQSETWQVQTQATEFFSFYKFTAMTSPGLSRNWM